MTTSKQKNAVTSPTGDFLLFQTEDGKTRIEVRLHDETVWLSLQQMAELFQRDKFFISKHIRNIFVESELVPGQIPSRHSVPQLGHPALAGVHHQGICHGRPADEACGRGKQRPYTLQNYFRKP